LVKITTGIPNWMRAVGEYLGFRELNFYGGLALLIAGGECLRPGAGLLMAGAFLVYYSTWRLK